MPTTLETQTLEPDWIPPQISEVQVVERDGVFLCLNPRVPAWFGTTRAGSLLLSLVDGRRSVADIQRLLNTHQVALSVDQLLGFFAAAKQQCFFDSEESSDLPEPWGAHRLEALSLHLMDRCNLQCSYCYWESSPRIPIQHGAERFCELLDFVEPFARPGLLLTFSGGEPLTYPGFEEVVRASSSHGFSRLQVAARGKDLSLRRVPGRRTRACHAGLTSLSIADTGDVYPCHLFHQPRFLLGNIFHDRFEDVFYGERAKRFARSMDVESNNPTCKACEVRFLCGGGCHAKTLFATGDPRGPDSYCSYLKKNIYDDLFALIGHPAQPREGLPVLA